MGERARLRIEELELLFHREREVGRGLEDLPGPGHVEHGY